MDENVTNTEETVHEKENEQTGKAAGSCLPLAADQLDLAKQYKQMMLIYEAGIRQLTTKLQILNREFEQSNDRNPIENIKSRIKSAESIAKKMERKGLPMTLSCLTNNIFDIAGAPAPLFSIPFRVCGEGFGKGNLVALSSSAEVWNPLQKVRPNKKP